MKKNRKKTGSSDFLFYCITGMIITFFFLIVLYPVIFVIAASFSSGDAVTAGKVFLWPVDFSLDGYQTVFHNSQVLTGFKNSFLYDS